MEQITITVEGYARARKEAQDLLETLFRYWGSSNYHGLQINLSREVLRMDPTAREDVAHTGEPADPAASHSTDLGSPERDVIRHLYKVRQVAKSLAISERTAWNLVSSGHLRSAKIGNSTRISLKDLERFVEGFENSASS